MFWRTLLRMTLFLMAFTLNVTVRAEVIQEPESCHNKSELPCSYFIQGHHELLTFDDHEVRLTKGTSFIRTSNDNYELVSGEALVQTRSLIRIKTLYGEVQVHKATALVKSDQKRMQFYSLAGAVKYQPRGMDSATFLPVGFSNFVSRVGVDGIANSGYPKPAELNDLLPLWASFFTQSESDLLQAQVTKYRFPWRVAVEKAGPLYVDTVRRQIAALEAERDRNRRLRAERLKEQNYFKEMFRRRNHL